MVKRKRKARRRITEEKGVGEYLVDTSEKKERQEEKKSDDGISDTIELLKAAEGPLDDATLHNAIERGHLADVCYLWKEMGIRDTDAVEHAIDSGHFEIVHFLIENGAKLRAANWSTAAECGHLDILRYLLEKGCPSCNSQTPSGCNEEGVTTCRHYRMFASEKYPFENESAN